MSKRGNAFLLLITGTNPVVKTQLYSIESDAPKGINDLIYFSNSNKYNPEYFNVPDYKHLILKPILRNKEFVEGKIIWSDSDIVILQHFSSNVANALMRITAFDASGKQLFTFSQKDFPSIDKMLEDYDTNFSILLIDDVTRENDRIYIIFGEYGAVCMDIITGKMTWKYENPF
jgi:outer membrane protein assembly factor BamB